jgi:hypothetical protein
MRLRTPHKRQWVSRFTKACFALLPIRFQMPFRMKIRPGLAILALLVCSRYPAKGGGANEGEIPSIALEALGVFPHGGMRGSSVKVTITGKNLKNVGTIRFSKPGLLAEIVSRRDSELVTKIEIDPDAEPGRHDFRLIGPEGSNIAWFDVGSLPEITETEPNDSPAQAQELTLPALVNGIVKKGDYDFYHFTVKGGETITFDLNGTRNGSPLDGVSPCLMRLASNLRTTTTTISSRTRILRTGSSGEAYIWFASTDPRKVVPRPPIIV